MLTEVKWIEPLGQGVACLLFSQRGFSCYLVNKGHADGQTYCEKGRGPRTMQLGRRGLSVCVWGE